MSKVEMLEVMPHEGESQGIFFQGLRAGYEGLGEVGLTAKLRARAWDRFLAVGLPGRRDEAFRYIPLHRLFAQPLPFIQGDGAAIERAGETTLVFVDGHYQPHLSHLESLPKGVVIAPIAQAMRQFGTFLNNRFAKAIQDEKDPFALLNFALHGDGVFVYIPPKMRLESPIHIVHILSAHEKAAMAHGRVQIMAGAQSEAVIVHNTLCHGAVGSWANLVCDVVVEEGARLSYVQWCEGEAGRWTFSALRGQVKRDAHLDAFAVASGGGVSREDYQVALVGENAEACLHGLWMLDGTDQHHVNVLLEHEAPHGRSMQLFKGVLGDKSRSSFEGKIYVHRPAQKTDAFQLNNNLLLSDKAAANSKPNLEIFADDVKASHGATVGQLDNELLFYLKTRGLSSDAAKGLLVAGFCGEVVEKIPVAPIRQKWLSQVHERFFRMP